MDRGRILAAFVHPVSHDTQGIPVQQAFHSHQPCLADAVHEAITGVGRLGEVGDQMVFVDRKTSQAPLHGPLPRQELGLCPVKGQRFQVNIGAENEIWAGVQIGGGGEGLVTCGVAGGAVGLHPVGNPAIGRTGTPDDEFNGPLHVLRRNHFPGGLEGVGKIPDPQSPVEAPAVGGIEGGAVVGFDTAPQQQFFGNGTNGIHGDSPYVLG